MQMFVVKRRGEEHGAWRSAQSQITLGNVPKRPAFFHKLHRKTCLCVRNKVHTAKASEVENDKASQPERFFNCFSRPSLDFLRNGPARLSKKLRIGKPKVPPAMPTSVGGREKLPSGVQRW